MFSAHVLGSLAIFSNGSIRSLQNDMHTANGIAITHIHATKNPIGHPKKMRMRSHMNAHRMPAPPPPCPLPSPLPVPAPAIGEDLTLSVYCGWMESGRFRYKKTAITTSGQRTSITALWSWRYGLLLCLVGVNLEQENRTGNDKLLVMNWPNTKRFNSMIEDIMFNLNIIIL